VKLFQAVIFGMIFGFLLQKGGVAKYHVLEGQLLLQDFTVMKIILSAILVGMIGFYLLHHRGHVKFHIKPVHVASNLIGGLIFGTGFAFAGYCPGTGAAALGQGNFHAVFYMTGMLVGAYFFAEVSAKLKTTIGQWGKEGKLTLPDAFHVNPGVFIGVFSLIILAVLYVFKGA
jgi:uncharacterized protein